MLTEKEKIQRAKMYMLKLADGINPIDDKEMNDDTILKNERLSKCFTYVAEVLDNAIQSNSPVKNTSKGKRVDFDITDKQIKAVAISSYNVPISEFVSEINKTVDNPYMKKLQPKTINDWLVDKGYLRNTTDYAGHIHRELTEKSSDIGIVSKQGIGTFGEYTIILYSEKAQKFIIDNISDIIKGDS